MQIAEPERGQGLAVEPVPQLLPETGLGRHFNSEPPVKFTQEIVEVGSARLFVAFDRQQLLEPVLPLLKNPAIRTFRDMPLHLPGNRLGQPPVGEVMQ